MRIVHNSTIMIMAEYCWNAFFSPVDKWLKTLTANQNPTNFKELDLELNYNVNDRRYSWNHFQNDFFMLRNNKNIDSQSESTRI